VIILSTLGGTANFAAQSLFENDENAKKYASFAIGGISIFAGMLTTIGNYLRYAQLEESHRVASITWGKFQRLLAVELALNPDDRMDSLDFLKICRAELDRLIEQSPPIPKDLIHRFEAKFGTIKDLKRPDVCGALEHTLVFESSEARLKNLAADAALMLRRKKNTLNELVSPQIEQKISEQVEARIAEALEERKKKLEAEIEMKREDERKRQEDFDKALEERKRKIQEEIDLEKKRLTQDSVHSPEESIKRMGGSQFDY
jgi:plasmid maintenance system antidote protein VapI